MSALSGRRALVTGGGRGIGRAVALDLGRAGAAVAVAARTRPEVEKVAAEVEGGGGRAVALTIDVADPESVRAAFAHAREALGGIDILVCGAGVAPTAPLARTSDAVWRQVLETNLSGTFYCLREALPEMTARGWGRVVNLASIAGKTGYPYIGAYAASKHGVLGLTKCAALEVATTGVTVNAVCPGYTDTDLVRDSLANIAAKTGRSQQAALADLLKDEPLGRLISPEEVAAAVLFLCSREAAAVTGTTLAISGGEL
jgi:NAD(P)-dependent dehydrogenase (short-subunit alcohol dehydrogenase family)